MSNSFGYHYGVLLEYVLNHLGIKTKRKEAKNILHIALKDYFEIDSVKGLSEGEMWLFVSKCLMILSREYGIYPPSPRLRDDSDELKFK